MKKTVLIHANYWDGERMCRDGRIEIADGYVGAVYGACDEQNLKPYNIEETCFEDMSGIYSEYQIHGRCHSCIKYRKSGCFI